MENIERRLTYMKIKKIIIGTILLSSMVMMLAGCGKKTAQPVVSNTSVEELVDNKIVEQLDVAVDSVAKTEAPEVKEEIVKIETDANADLPEEVRAFNDKIPCFVDGEYSEELLKESLTEIFDGMTMEELCEFDDKLVAYYDVIKEDYPDLIELYDSMWCDAFDKDLALLPTSAPVDDSPNIIVGGHNMDTIHYGEPTDWNAPTIGDYSDWDVQG